MIPFEEIWLKAREVPGYYVPEQSRFLYEAACKCSGNMLEIGTLKGRSASVLAAAAAQTRSTLVCVDPSVTEAAETLGTYDIPLILLRMSSLDAAGILNLTYSLIHIDGAHEDSPDAGPRVDCRIWLPRLRPGGFACFHDYGMEFDDVTKAVDHYTTGWEFVGNFERLAIRRKP